MRDSPYELDMRAARAAGAVQRGSVLRMPCPVHDSSPETLAIRQGDRAPLWHCHAGCDPADVRDGPVGGGAVRLANPDGGALAVAEGIETALAYAALTGTPTWAALSASGMKQAEIPDGLAWLAIAADFDGPGLQAAEQLERRARDAGIAVRIDLPFRHGADWADVLAKSRRHRAAP